MIPFVVERVVTIQDRGVVVLARSLAEQNFVLTDRATLDGVPIERWTDIPRTLKPDGGIRLDLFAFKLRAAEDKEQFQEGQQVELNPG